MDSASERGERSVSVGSLTLGLASCLAYYSNISVDRQGHMVMRYLQLASFPERFGLSAIEGKAQGVYGTGDLRGVHILCSSRVAGVVTC